MRVQTLINTQPHRQTEFNIWNKILRDIGKNRQLNNQILNDSSIDMTKPVVISTLKINVLPTQNTDDDLDALQAAAASTLINSVYPEMNSDNLPYDYFAHKIIVAPRNCDVKLINNTALSLFRPQEQITSFTATNTLDLTDPNNVTEVPVEVLDSIEAPGNFYKFYT
jgi:hypothetical protein